MNVRVWARVLVIAATVTCLAQAGIASARTDVVGSVKPSYTALKPVPDPGRSISAATRAKMDAQRPLIAAASRIQWSIERSHAVGYAGVGLGVGEVVVWWKGAPPQVVADTIASVRGSTKVRVVPAVHSRAELEAAAKGVETYLRANPRSPYHGVDIAYDGSGLTINVDPAGTRAATLPSALPAGMGLPSGIQVSVVSQPRPQLTGRVDDYPEYWGGGRIQNNDNDAFCTAGFAVTAGGANYMLTAGHCGRVGGGWNNGNDANFFGTGAYENPGHDLLLVSADVGGRIWDGGVGSGEFTKGVTGWDWVFAGEWLCTSGSVTGAQCDDVVSNSFQYAFCDHDVYNNYECYNDLIVAYQNEGLTASRHGDSGGPVFGLSGTDQVVAMGTITGSVGTNGLIFQDFATAWRDFGVVPVTG
jgi:hypothetical protein